MSLKLGSTTINGLYLGSTAINAVYLGSTQVFGAAGGGTPAYVQHQTAFYTAARSFSQLITPPSGVTLGNRLVAFVGAVNTMNIDTSASGAGWTELIEDNRVGNVYGACFTKIADGDDALYIEFNAGANDERSASVMFEISDAGGTPVAASTDSFGTSLDPASVDMGSAGDYLAIATCFTPDTVFPTGYPSGYSNTGNTAGNGVGAYAEVSFGTKVFTTQVEDPGAFTISANANFATITIGLKAV